eukprot:280829-Chlamydomonas_euryale.AAC.14
MLEGGRSHHFKRVGGLGEHNVPSPVASVGREGGRLLRWVRGGRPSTAAPPPVAAADVLDVEEGMVNRT